MNKKSFLDYDLRDFSFEKIKEKAKEAYNKAQIITDALFLDYSFEQLTLQDDLHKEISKRKEVPIYPYKMMNECQNELSIYFVLGILTDLSPEIHKVNAKLIISGNMVVLQCHHLEHNYLIKSTTIEDKVDEAFKLLRRDFNKKASYHEKQREEQRKRELNKKYVPANEDLSIPSEIPKLKDEELRARRLRDEIRRQRQREPILYYPPRKRD